MAVALIADAHLGGPGGPAGPLLEQLRALPDLGCEHLVLLGDLFHVWVGDGRFETPEIVRVVDALRELRAAGLPVDYIEGNRDFFLDRSPYADAFRRIARELAFEVGGVSYLAVHGDGLDERDRQYRLWRRLSKSPPSRFLLTHIPRRFAQRIVGSTEKRLAGTNLRHKRVIPEEVIRRYAERRLAEDAGVGGHDCLLLGHFHEERRWQVKGGRVWLLDAWFHSRRVEWLGRDRP
jgi:UDP-2,3-diacylglucosamine pyrophosphatase LpxH